MAVELTPEGEAVAREISHRLIKIAGFFGIANVAALVGIFIYVWGVAGTTARQTAETRVSAIVSDIENDVRLSLNSANAVIQSAVLDASAEIGDAREAIGATKADFDSVQARIESLQDLLSGFFEGTNAILDEEELGEILKLIDSYKELENPASLAISFSELKQQVEAIRNSQTFSAKDLIISVTNKTDNGPNDGTDNGRLESRDLRFFKNYEASRIRVLYSDNLRARGRGSACRWTVKVDGADCDEGQIYTDRHDGNGSNVHSQSSFIGYCGKLKSGWHTLQVWVSPSPHGDGAFAGSDCYTGWNGSTWTLETTEILAAE